MVRRSIGMGCRRSENDMPALAAYYGQGSAFVGIILQNEHIERPAHENTSVPQSGVD